MLGEWKQFMDRFFSKVKNVSYKDLIHFLLFAAALIPAWILKHKRPHLWLICEYGKEARDNGFWFYKYVCENHPEQDVVYAIEKSSEDAAKVEALGQTISYGTFRHWIYYLAADLNISSQKGGKPNAAVCYLLEVYGFLKNKRVFLQHGITKDKTDVFVYKNTKFRLFICGARPEHKFVSEEFGYPEGYVAYTGFARFDSLNEPVTKKRQILVAPTWRSWLRTGSSDPYKAGANKDIQESHYYKMWREFLLSERIRDILDTYDFQLVFYPHRNVYDCFRGIQPNTDRIMVADFAKSDLQVLMKESMMMVTDYSRSVMDVSYMEKPVIYYQFDLEEFRDKHFEEGYFNYVRDGFGPVCTNLDDVLDAAEEICAGQCVMDPGYRAKVDAFFELRDNHNCQRIYDRIMEL